MSSLNFVTAPVISFSLGFIALTTCFGQESIIPEFNTDNYQLAYSDDFEKGSDAWETTDDKAWEIFLRDSNHSFGLNKRRSNYQPKYRSPHNIALLKGKQFSDFVLELNVKSTKDTGAHRDCCLFFGYQDPNHFYYVHLGAQPDPNSGQIMIVNNAARRALTDNKNRVPWGNQWHKIRLSSEAATGKFQIYFDDMTTPLMTTTDKTFSHGQIGIGSFDDMNNFDNIKIYVPKK